MTNKFTCFPPSVADDGLLRASLPVYGSNQWNPHARLANWLMSRGGTLVSAFGPAYAITEAGFFGINAGASQGFWYYIWPHEQNVVRQWNVSIGRNVGNVWGEIYLNGAAVRDWRITEDAGLFVPQNFTFYQTIDPPNGDPTGVLLQVSHDAASTAGEPYISYVSCYELPRVDLAAHEISGFTPPDANTLSSGQLIHEGGASRSLHSVAKAVQDARHQARRTSLYTWSNPDGVANATTTFAEALATISPFPRQRYAGETTRNLDWAAYMTHVGATGSEVRVRSDYPATSSTVVVSATGWVTGTIEVNSEDPARLHIDGGIRDGNRNIVRVDIRATTTTEAKIISFALGETE